MTLACELFHTIVNKKNPLALGFNYCFFSYLLQYIQNYCFKVIFSFLLFFSLLQLFS